jgi:hypothetical protein
MRTKGFVLLLGLALCYSLFLILSAEGQSGQSNAKGMPASAFYRTLPVTFEANNGQTGAQARFISRGIGYTAFLTNGGMVLSLRPSPSAAQQSVSSTTASTQPLTVLEFNLVGANPNPAVVGEDPQPGKVNYFIGNDRSKWHTNVATYAKVRYRNVYPGIDLIYYGNNRQLEYDFAISPGADPGKIQFAIKGANGISLDSENNLVLNTEYGDLRFNSPMIYQESNGSRVAVEGKYVIRDSTHIGFSLSPFDPTKPVVIDPVLDYATYLGGSSSDQASGIAVDSAGNVYVTGFAEATDFPLADPRPMSSAPSNTSKIFVAKLDPTGSSLIYADYLGGSSNDYAFALALDSANDVYVTGSTSSVDFPVVNPYQSSLAGAFNAFVTEISADGSTVTYSTYFGGNGTDVPAAIVLDSSSDIFIAGNTSSTNLPVENAYQSSVSPSQGGAYGNYGFLTEFNAGGAQLAYSTYFAGNTNVSYSCGSGTCWPAPLNAINGLALDSGGNAYVAGFTNTYNFPTTSGAFQTSSSAPQNNMAGFVSKFNTSGALAYSTYFDESSGNLTSIAAIAVDSTGSAYVTGSAVSDGTFPVTSTSICNPSVSGTNCQYVFVTKFDPTGSTLLYSTFLGANNQATPVAISLDASNNAYVLAFTSSDSFQIVNGIEGFSVEGSQYTAGNDDIIVAEINVDASSEVFATYFGGSGNNISAAMALDASGDIYIAGTTDSIDLPVTQGSLQPILGGDTDAFIAKIGPASEPAVSAVPFGLQFSTQAIGSVSPSQAVLLRNMGSAALSISSLIASAGFSQTNNCGNSVPAAGTCTISVSFAPTSPGSFNGSVSIVDDAAGSPHTISLSGNSVGAVVGFSSASLTFGSLPVGTASSPQTVTVTNNGNALLSISGISVSGNFSQTNNCGASLGVGLNCQIQVTFTAATSGINSGQITLTGNASETTQTLALSGTGLDFSLTAPNSSETIQAGGTATYTLSVAPLGGSFPNAVQLSCSGLPAQASCTFSPSSLIPGTTQQTVTLTIATAASAQAIVRHSSNYVALASWMPIQGLGLFGVVFVGSRKRMRKSAILTLMTIAIASLIFMSACAGGTGIAPHQSQTGAAPETYTVSVNGTSGNIKHSVPLTMTVQ